MDEGASGVDMGENDEDGKNGVEEERSGGDNGISDDEGLGRGVGDLRNESGLEEKEEHATDDVFDELVDAVVDGGMNNVVDILDEDGLVEEDDGEFWGDSDVEGRTDVVFVGSGVGGSICELKVTADGVISVGVDLDEVERGPRGGFV
jgi:hypothetical protein